MGTKSYVCRSYRGKTGRRGGFLTYGFLFSGGITRKLCNIGLTLLKWNKTSDRRYQKLCFPARYYSSWYNSGAINKNLWTKKSFNSQKWKMAPCVFSISRRIQGPIEKLISAQCCIAVWPENITKPLDFLISECIAMQH